MTMNAMPTVSPARCDRSQNGQENAYANAKNQISGWRTIRLSDWPVDVVVEFMSLAHPDRRLIVWPEVSLPNLCALQHPALLDAAHLPVSALPTGGGPGDGSVSGCGRNGGGAPFRAEQQH
jgi:hypothetical protein